MSPDWIMRSSMMVVHCSFAVGRHMGVCPVDDICAFISRAVCCWWIHDFGPVMLRLGLGVLGRVPWRIYCTVCFRCSVENPHWPKIWLRQLSVENPPPHRLFVVLDSSILLFRLVTFNLNCICHCQIEGSILVLEC